LLTRPILSRRDLPTSPDQVRAGVPVDSPT
jgi:hypothetical protein